MPRRIKAGDPKLAVAYLRTSTDRQELGPEAQRRDIEQWAARGGVAIVAWHYDQISGGSEMADRPELGAALRALRDHGAGVFVVQKRDRLARDVSIARAIEAEAARAGARVVSADGSGNDDGPNGKLLRTMLDAFSEHERLVIGMRIKAALAAKKRRGERMGTVAFGYADAGDGRGTLVPDPREQAAVTFVVAQRAAGMSMRAIVRACAEQNVCGRTGQPLELTQVARILAAFASLRAATEPESPA